MAALKATKTAVIRGNMLTVEGTDTEEVAKLIMAETELAGRYETSKAAHTSIRPLTPRWSCSSRLFK